MSWNYRIISHQSNHIVGNDDTYALHEVYYNSLGKPEFYTKKAICIEWPMEEGVHIGKDILLKMLEAFEKPVLGPEDFKNDFSKNRDRSDGEDASPCSS